MKRRALEKHLRKNGCVFYKEGGKHTAFINPHNAQKAYLPRHTEVKKPIALKICDDLRIPRPNSAA